MHDKKNTVNHMSHIYIYPVESLPLVGFTDLSDALWHQLGISCGCRHIYQHHGSPGSLPPRDPRDDIPKDSLKCVGVRSLLFKTGWWFGTCFIFPLILEIIIPID